MPQIACIAANDAGGALKRLIAHIHNAHPGTPIILDAKHGDAGTEADLLRSRR